MLACSVSEAKISKTIKLARKQMYITMNVSYTDKKNT